MSLTFESTAYRSIQLLFLVDSQRLMTMACHEIVDLRQDDIIAYYQNGSTQPVHEAICGGLRKLI